MRELVIVILEMTMSSWISFQVDLTLILSKNDSINIGTLCVVSRVHNIIMYSWWYAY